MSGTPVEIDTFWSSYLQTKGQRRQSTSPPPEAWGFGDNAEMANDLGQLVIEGVKTATCSLLWEYEAEGETLPHKGELSIILDGDGQPLCIIQTVQVKIVPFEAVDADFAYDEGEGDRSLAYWRATHWRSFSRVCQKLGHTVSPDMLLVCERFQVIYKLD
jgi:uncharacterized protein YhfF